MLRYLVVLVVFLQVTSIKSQNVYCNFKITFRINLLDEVDRCTFGFLHFEGTKFTQLKYTVKQSNLIVIEGQMYYDCDEYSEQDFPKLWIQKRIKGEEHIQGVRNLYLDFYKFEFNNNIVDIDIGTLCPIEQTMIGIYKEDDIKLRCLNFTPDCFEDSWFFLNYKEIRKI